MGLDKIVSLRYSVMWKSFFFLHNLSYQINLSNQKLWGEYAHQTDIRSLFLYDLWYENELNMILNNSEVVSRKRLNTKINVKKCISKNVFTKFWIFSKFRYRLGIKIQN